MPETEMQQNLSSYVSFALAIQPHLELHSRCAHEPEERLSLELNLQEKKTLADTEVSSLEALMRKYEPLQKILHVGDSSAEKTGFKIETCMPIVNYKPNVEYQSVALNAEQLHVARETAKLVETTYAHHKAGEGDMARSAYDRLQNQLDHQRSKMIGNLKSMPQILNATALHGVGRNGNPVADMDCGGAVIFVIIEIFVC